MMMYGVGGTGPIGGHLVSYINAQPSLCTAEKNMVLNVSVIKKPQKFSYCVFVSTF